MGFKRKLRWPILVLIPLLLFTGCGDLEPDMQDTRTVILKMDFNQKSSSRSSSSVSAAELSNYKTHLIMALPSREYLTSSYKNFYSSFAQGLMNTADKKVSLEIPLNTQMKIFAFLFKEDYSMSELFSGVREVGYYGESQSFSIGTQTYSLSLGITLQSTGTDTNTGGGSTDTTPPVIAEVTAVTTPTNDSTPDYTFSSTEAGTITYGGSCSSSRTSAISGNNYLTFSTLSGGNYSNCTIKVTDSAGNASNTLTITSFTVMLATDYALDFDGTNDYVVANGVTSNLNSSTGLPFTVSAWAYPDTTTRGAIFAFNKSGANLNLLFYAQDGSTKKFYHYDPNTSYKTGNTNTFEPGQWHHIALIVDSSGNGKLYINGGQEATWSNGSNSLVNRFSIGQEWDSATTASDFFDGKIDEVAIWNVALSTADVTALYNSRNGLKASADSGNYDNSGDLIGYWKFNEGTGSTLTDSTSNSNNGTLTHMDSSDWVTSGFNLID